MPSALNNAEIFLINTLFDLYIFVLIIRLILVFVRADYFNPLSQFIVKLTNPIITPLKRLIPNMGRIETATLIVLLILEIIKFSLVGMITIGIPNPAGLPILAIADAIKTLLTTLFYAIFLQAILSWVQPGYSPISKVLSQITAPILRPIQRIIPPIAGFDISPIFALIGLQVLSMLITTPLFNIGLKLAF